MKHWNRYCDQYRVDSKEIERCVSDQSVGQYLYNTDGVGGNGRGECEKGGVPSSE